MHHTTNYKLLTFYTFVDISDPTKQVKEHKQFCEDIGMKGRIYIGTEGISSTITGNTGQILAYKMFLNNNPYFNSIEDIDTKATDVDGHQFDKMIVKEREEIVTLGKVVNQAAIDASNKIISIDDMKRIIDQKDEERIILDMRNDYERQLGHFKGAVPAGTVNFREVQDLVTKYKNKFKDKKVVMYCTGGIRCEKLSVLLQDEGVDNFYALDGGVVKYTNLKNDGNRLGNLYTFDGRVSCPIGDEQTHTTIAKCIYSQEPTDTCENCRYSPCNARILVTQKAYRKHFGLCSEECAEKAKKDLLIKNAERDPIDYKSLRALVKQDPTQKEAISHHISNHIKKNLLHTTFNHKTSQKEKVLIDW